MKRYFTTSNIGFRSRIFFFGGGVYCLLAYASLVGLALLMVLFFVTNGNSAFFCIRK